jgi:hypothetical protein
MAFDGFCLGRPLPFFFKSLLSGWRQCLEFVFGTSHKAVGTFVVGSVVFYAVKTYFMVAVGSKQAVSHFIASVTFSLLHF